MAETTTQAKRGRKFESPGHYTNNDREKMDDADFGDAEGRRYPIITQQDVHDAASLIGKAGSEADKARIKARIVSIAKRKGFSIPAAWQENGDSGRADGPTDTRVVGDDLVEPVFVAPITRVDPERRLVTVTATDESVDSFHTIFDYDASKKAFLQWIGNVREMHQPKAVGTRVAVDCDDEKRKIDVTLRVSKGAQDTWEKVLDGTLKGASIGASDVTWEHPRATNGAKGVPVARDYRLVELSLVDNPSNPSCANITVVRNAEPDTEMLDEIETPEERAAAEIEEFTRAAESDLAEEHAAAMADAPRLSGVVNTGVAAVPMPTGVAAPAVEQRATETTPPQQIIVTPPITQRVDPRALERRRRDEQGRADQEYIRAAGDAAESAANIAPMNPERETYQEYIARRAAVRAGAEARAIEELRVQRADALRAAQAPTQAVATPVTQPQPSVIRAAAKKNASAAAAPSDEKASASAKSSAKDAAGSAAADGDLEAPDDADAGEDNERAAIPYVQTASMSPSTDAAALGTNSRMHSHGHEHGDGMGHESHTHTHSHEDGSSHEHPHVHLHDHQNHHASDYSSRAAGGSMAPHTHDHTHAHDHLHTYRAGQPTDSRLAVADTTRAPFGTPSDASDNRPAPAKVGSHDTGQLSTIGGGGTGAGKAVSPVLSVQPQAVGHLSLFNSEDGQALMGGVPAAAEQRPTPTSDVTLNPSDFHEGGHPQYAGAPDRTTHATGANADQFDSDGDHDGAAEDAQPPLTGGLNPPAAKRPDTLRPTDGFSAAPTSGYGQVPGPRAATPDEVRALVDSLHANGLITAEQARTLSGIEPGIEPGIERGAQGANASNMGVVHVDASTTGVAPGVDDDSGEYAGAEGNDGDADDVETPARPPRATQRPAGNGPATPEVGKSPSDTSVAPYFSPERPAGAATLGKDGGLAGSGPGATVQRANAQRKGARVSVESRAALHGMRDSALESVKRACQHCNSDGECPECADLMAVLNGGAFDKTGDHSADDDSAPDNDSDTAFFGSLRVVTALVLRDQQRLFRDLTTEMRAQMAALREENAELRVQLQDMQLTLADHQRGAVTRMTQGVEERLAAREQSLTQMISADVTRAVTEQVNAQMSQVTQQTIQRLEALAESVSGVGADVERIAAQPAPLAQAPILYGSDKRLALHEPYGQQGVSRAAGDLSADDQMRVLQELAQTLAPGDVAARTAIAGRMATLSARPFSLGGVGTTPGGR